MPPMPPRSFHSLLPALLAALVMQPAVAGVAGAAAIHPAQATQDCAAQPGAAGAMPAATFHMTSPPTAHAAQPRALCAGQPATADRGLAAVRMAQPGADNLRWHLAFGGLTLDQAVRMAQARYGARVVRADTERNGDRVYYRLRLLSSDGRVFSVRVDAQTGEMQ